MQWHASDPQFALHAVRSGHPHEHRRTVSTSTPLHPPRPYIHPPPPTLAYAAEPPSFPVPQIPASLTPGLAPGSGSAPRDRRGSHASFDGRLSAPGHGPAFFVDHPTARPRSPMASPPDVRSFQSAPAVPQYHSPPPGPPSRSPPPAQYGRWTGPSADSMQRTTSAPAPPAGYAQHAPYAQHVAHAPHAPYADRGGSPLALPPGAMRPHWSGPSSGYDAPPPASPSVRPVSAAPEYYPEASSSRPTSMTPSRFPPEKPEPPVHVAPEDEDDIEHVLALSLRHEEEERARAQAEEEELARVLAESARLEGAPVLPMPCGLTSEEEERARAQEEEDFARALAESAAMAGSDPHQPSMPTPTVPQDYFMPTPMLDGAEAVPDDVLSTNTHSASHDSSLFSHAASASTTATSAQDEQEASEHAQWQAQRTNILHQLEDDEALARRLAEEDDDDLAAPTAAASSSTGKAHPLDGDAEPAAPPPYEPRADGPSLPVLEIGAPQDTEPPMQRSQSASAVQSPVARLGWDGRVPPAPGTMPGHGKQRSLSLGPDGFPVHMPVPEMWEGAASPQSAVTLTAGLRASGGTSLSHSLVEEDEDAYMSMPAGPSRATTPMPPSTDEIFMGVTVGFNSPTLSNIVQPLSGPFPNTISLPYGRCPPLHIQAGSWRRLLMLLARMSTSKLEPTVEALALHREAVTLRTVIQFVRLHPNDPEWRCVIYLSLDHPPPPGAAVAWKYKNGDTCTLPYSYSLGAVPALLRGAAESPLARTYTIPATESTPFPRLPLVLPNFVSYLHSALADSRRASGDASGGLRRLAKIIDECYPEVPDEDGGEADDKERRRGLFGLFGKGKRKEKHKGGGNADTYEIITPFVLDANGGD